MKITTEQITFTIKITDTEARSIVKFINLSTEANLTASGLSKEDIDTVFQLNNKLVLQRK
jgi:hypothetical protein